MTFDSQDVYTKIIHLSTRVDQNFIELGRLLRELKKREKELFKLAYEQSGLGRRIAYHFVAIVRQFEAVPITDEQLAEIGWTKADVIGKHITQDNWAELLAEAKHRSARELRILVNGGRLVRGTKSITLHFDPEQHKKFVAAIATYGSDPMNREQALMSVIDAAGGAAL